MEPEKPIEKMLRAMAEKRRADAGEPMPLHPANRRALQAEVARVYGSRRASKATFFEALTRLWPQLGWSFALLTGLAIATSLMLPRRHGQDAMQVATYRESDSRSATPLASQEANKADTVQNRLKEEETLASRQLSLGEKAGSKPPTTSERVDNARTVSPAEAAAPADGFAANEAFRLRYGLAPAAPGGPPAVAPSSPMPGRDQKEYAQNAPAPAQDAAKLKSSDEIRLRSAGSLGADGKTAAPSSRVQLAERREATITDSTALADAAAKAKDSVVAGSEVQKKRAFATLRQKFARVDAQAAVEKNLSPPPASGVLASFELEQDAVGIRIVDKDGSIYSGSLQPSQTLARRFNESAAATNQLRSFGGGFNDNESKSAQPAFSFQVAGTNLTLGERVVFRGDAIIPPTAQPAPEGQTAAGIAGATNVPAAGIPNLTNARIVGELTIGAGAPTRMQAGAQRTP